MAKFIKLTSANPVADDKSILINIEHIVEVAVNGFGQTILNCAYEKVGWIVEESIEEVEAKINE